jgi:alkane 1-monooxygenase
MDRLGGRAQADTVSSTKPGKGFAAILVGLALLQVGNILLAVSHTFQNELSLAETLTAIVLLGASSAHTLLVAHELIHKPRRDARLLGRALLGTLLYDHFFIEHLRGHHAHAATEKDPSTAAFDEPF